MFAVEHPFIAEGRHAISSLPGDSDVSTYAPEAKLDNSSLGNLAADAALATACDCDDVIPLLPLLICLLFPYNMESASERLEWCWDSILCLPSFSLLSDMLMVSRRDWRSPIRFSSLFASACEMSLFVRATLLPATTPPPFVFFRLEQSIMLSDDDEASLCSLVGTISPYLTFIAYSSCRRSWFS